MSRPILELDWDPDPPAPAIRLRGRQQEWVDAIERDWGTHSRLLMVAPGGVGKSSVAAVIAFNAHQRGLKTLVLENRDRLTRQTADRIAKETGLDVDVEMADQHASPFTPIVVACVQSLGRENRLTGFADSHFGILICDECHFSMAPLHQRIMRYFHYGAESLAEGWVAPQDEAYEPKCKIMGMTATPDIGERRNLGDFYTFKSVDYSYLEAVQDGWLIAPIQKSIPVKIDLRKFRAQSGPLGMDFKAQDLSAVIAPIIEELAAQVAEHAWDRKTMAFLPSVECARMLSEALTRRGMFSVYCSGECLDVDEKTEAFVNAGPGSVLSNCAIYNFGVDFPDVDCIAWFRATLSRAFFIQGIYRASRVVLPPGVLEGCADAEERKDTIAASRKKNYLVLDPLFVSDRIDLLDAYDLFTDKPEVKEQMKAAGELTPEAAQKGERDFLAALAKEARKHARKQSRTIDPLKWALDISDTAITNYAPVTAADSRPPSLGQITFFQKNHIDYSRITSAGLASKIIGRYLARLSHGLASAQQLTLLKQLGLPEDQCASITRNDASATIDRILREKREG